MYSFTSRQFFFKKFYAVENTAEQHYGLLNILELISHNGYLYCFCKKYFGPHKEFGSALCPLCRMTYFLNNYNELLDQTQFSPCKLGFYFFQLFDFLDECFLVDKESLTLVDDDYQITSHGNYTGQKTSVSLRDYINWTTDIKKRNGEKKYFNFFINVLFFSL